MPTPTNASSIADAFPAMAVVPTRSTYLRRREDDSWCGCALGAMLARHAGGAMAARTILDAVPGRVPAEFIADQLEISHARARGIEAGFCGSVPDPFSGIGFLRGYVAGLVVVAILRRRGVAWRAQV